MAIAPHFFFLGPVKLQNGVNSDLNRDLPLVTLYDGDRLFLKIIVETRMNDEIYVLLQECNFLTIKTQTEFNNMIDRRQFVWISRHNIAYFERDPFTGEIALKFRLQGVVTHVSPCSTLYHESRKISYTLWQSGHLPLSVPYSSLASYSGDPLAALKACGRVWPMPAPAAPSTPPVPSSGMAAAPAAPSTPKETQTS